MISANDREGEDFNVYKDFPRYKPAPCFYMIEKPVSSFYFIEKFLSLSTRKIHRACRLCVVLLDFLWFRHNLYYLRWLFMKIWIPFFLNFLISKWFFTIWFGQNAIKLLHQYQDLFEVYKRGSVKNIKTIGLKVSRKIKIPGFAFIYLPEKSWYWYLHKKI